jgi:hypothetical protein
VKKQIGLVRNKTKVAEIRARAKQAASRNGNGRHGQPEPEDTMRYVDPETGDYES